MGRILTGRPRRKIEGVLLRRSRAHHKPYVAIINSNDDLVALLRETLEDEGFMVVTTHIRHIKSGKEDLPRFLKQHDPDVIVYDLAPPYCENWRFLGLLRETFGSRGLVLTTVNRKALEKSVGRIDVHELEGRRSDLSRVVRAVLDEVKTRKR
jgi:CheY-like chemotaxis protein